MSNYFTHNMNATRAYIATYPKSTYESARRLASQLLTNVDIKDEISKRLKEKHLSAEEVLYRLAEQAQADYSSYLLPNGTVDLAKLLADGKGHLIHKVKETKYGTEVEFYDAQTALLNVGKQHGLLNDRHVIEVKVEKEIDSILSILEEILSPDDLSNILSRLSNTTISSTETTETEE